MNKLRLIDTSRIDYLLVVSVFFLVIFGAAIVYSASSYRASLYLHDSAFYFKSQMFKVILGSVLMFVIALLDYHKWLKMSTWLYVISVIILLFLLMKVRPFCVTAKGATRWLRIGPVQIQPSDFARYAMIMMLTNFIAKNHFKARQMLDGYIVNIILMGLVVVPVALQRDLGTALIISMTAFIIFFFADTQVRFMVWSGLALAVLGIVFLLLNPYQMEKITVFWNNLFHNENLPYQLKESLIGLAMGGLFGTGIGNSRLKFQWLPEAHKDFIFSIIGEEIGWIGAVGILILFLVVLYRGIKIAENAPDLSGRLLAGGITACIGTYAMINTAVALAVLPTTGIPMPFISYGGSSLVSHLAALGLLINISAQSNASYNCYSSAQTYTERINRNTFQKPARRSTSQLPSVMSKVRMF